MRNVFLFFLITINFGQLFGQVYNISVKIKDANSELIQLAYYYQDKQYVVEQKKTNKNGEIIFSGKNKLPRGIYMITMPSKQMYFDILLADDQVFEIKADTTGTVEKIKIKGSEENKLFFDYEIKTAKFNSLMQELNKYNKDSLIYKEKHEYISNGISKIRKEYSEKYPNTLLTKLINAMDVPDEPDKLWSKIDFNETGLIRTPFFETILLTHIARNIEKGAYKIISENNILLKNASINPEMLKYIAFYFLTFYRTHQRNGINEVFVNLSDNYFLNGKIKNLDDKIIKMVKEQRDIFASSMINAKAKNVKLADMKGDSVSLYDYKSKYILVYFWSSGCGHCEKASDYMKENYKKIKRKGFEIFAINSNEKNFPRLEKYINENPMPWEIYHDFKNTSRCKEYYYAVNSPLIYVLNKERIIINKLSGHEQIIDFVKKL